MEKRNGSSEKSMLTSLFYSTILPRPERTLNFEHRKSSMLNYIWLALIVIGVLVAVGNDWHDLSTNKYHNGEQISTTIHLSDISVQDLKAGQKYMVSMEIPPKEFEERYHVEMRTPILLHAELIPSLIGLGIITITVDNQAPIQWIEIAKLQKKDNLAATVRWQDTEGRDLNASLMLDAVKFVKLNAVTNDGILKSAKTAVELAIGLIGVMALWLGIMKIADQSGLVAKLASVLKPITTRLFPDVPADHPAMGAMIMNISANMLGLANAATPLGLKAMEELNKLNKKLGTATDAMCTFLVINTSNVQLIPATVIAIRAASGSANPTEILGPVIVATFVALIVGVTTAKLLARLPYFKRQLQVSE